MLTVCDDGEDTETLGSTESSLADKSAMAPLEESAISPPSDSVNSGCCFRFSGDEANTFQ